MKPDASAMLILQEFEQEAERNPTMAETERPFMPNWASVPGSTIIDFLNENNLSKDEFALRMGWSLEQVENLLTGFTEIDYKIAQLLSKAIGASTAFWLRRERQYRKDLFRISNL